MDLLWSVSPIPGAIGPLRSYIDSNKDKELCVASDGIEIEPPDFDSWVYLVLTY